MEGVVTAAVRNAELDFGVVFLRAGFGDREIGQAGTLSMYLCFYLSVYNLSSIFYISLIYHILIHLPIKQ